MIMCPSWEGFIMKGQLTDQKITIKAAAQILGVSTKSIHRYLSKGRLTKIKEGTRTLLLLPEVKALENDTAYGQGRPSGASGKSAVMGQVGDMVTLNRERYDQLLLELGELRKQNQFFLELKGLMLAREESLRRLEHNVKQLWERVDTLERKRPSYPLVPAREGEESAGGGDSAKTKRKKPWWQA
jgi:predicted site-specific integrase-resolvase